MNAVLCTQYGPPEVLKLQKVRKPEPRDNEVLIRIRATTVTAGDIRIRAFRSPALMWLPMRLVLGITKPRKPILGVELSGEIEAIGSKVTRFKAGDQVFAMTGMKFGAHAEYLALPEKGLIAIKPEQVSFETAASVLYGGTTALHFLRKGNIRSGQKVMVYGASGTVGTLTVQLAKYFGAEVTGVCSTGNLEMVKALGADKVIDYTKENFTETGERYDMIFDAVGKTTKAHCEKALAAGGAFVTVGGMEVARELMEDVLLLQKLLAEGKIKSVIDRTYTLEQMVEAHRYVENGRKKGSVVIQVL
ncbi:NAD(P)-dependent alcohol dehydrogenase [Xylanibacillus composti]|uniref:Alcohol dehydrogenase n=1 Tax=Xylanibacillus composti TaxID=1572762 RepID=A0A8J4H3V2_9BACL|nr:NAD(P)-dependent alcohol dehydrogenase [Xylanibacillus composti]MDT9724859.1 NAD(P)-dependent alcohol dehydrogenase [Xylanibacillus composti]GIQ69046.1 alcohol dehydrogenase [Xylanibacillus composti]